MDYIIEIDFVQGKMKICDFFENENADGKHALFCEFSVRKRFF